MGTEGIMGLFPEIPAFPAFPEIPENSPKKAKPFKLKSVVRRAQRLIKGTMSSDEFL